MAAQAFNFGTIDNLVDALTQLQGMEGGYEALAGGLGEAYPGATFSPGQAGSYGQGFQAQNWEPAYRGSTVPGFIGQNFNLGEAAVRAGLAGGATPIGNWPAAYEAMWPTLTGLVNPSRGIGKMGPDNLYQNKELTDIDTAPYDTGDSIVAGSLGKQHPTQEGVVTGGKSGDDEKGKEFKGGVNDPLAWEANFPKTHEGWLDYVKYLNSKSGLSADEISRRGTEFYKIAHPVVAETQTNVATGETADAGNAAVGGVGGVDRTVEKAVIGQGIKPGFEPTDDQLPGAKALPEPVTKPVRDYTPIGSEGPETGEVLPHKPGSKIPHSPDLDKDTTPDITPGSDDINITESSTDIDTEYRDKYPPGVSAGPAPKKGLGIIPSDDRQQKETNEITKGMSGNQKAEVGNITNQAINYLKSTGWADSGEWGYARTRNMLTGGGQGQVVTQGPLVPWKSMGRDASSTDYISNVGGQDYLPSRLAPGERLGETTTTGELGYVPEERREGWDQPVIINQVHPGAGEPGSIMNQHLEDLSGDISFKDIPGGLTDIPTISLKTQAGINDIRANADINTLKKADSVEGIANILSGGKAVAGKIVETFTNLLGISDSDVKGDGFWTKMTTPIEAISTKEFGITPLDIALIVAGGMPVLGSIMMGKLANAMFKPITSLFTNGLSGVFDAVFSGDKTKLGPMTASDASQNAVSDVQSMLKGLGQNAYAIDKGTLYGPSGNVLGSNMQSVTFDAAGNSTLAGDIRIGPNDTVDWSDPSKGGTGKVWVNGEDTGKVVIKDNNGEPKLGDSKTSGASVPTKKEGPTTSVPVVGVSTISTVISGPGSRKKEDDDDENKPPEESEG